MCRIVLADSRELVRRGIQAILESSLGFEIVAEASNHTEAMSLIARSRPDVGIIGSLPSLSTTVSMVRASLGAAADSRTRFLIVGDVSSSAKALEELPQGASRYLPLGASSVELLASIRALHSSGDDSRFRSANRAGHRDATLPRLTPREVEVLRNIAAGRRTWEIAEQLGISRKTVETHRSALMRKLQLHRVADVVRYAVRSRLIDC